MNLDVRPERLISGISSRVFEVLLCGSFPLTEYRPALDRHFLVGEEIAVFESAEEAREKALYYVSHEDERLAMVRRGRDRVRRDWTFGKTVPQMLQQIDCSVSRQ